MTPFERSTLRWAKVAVFMSLLAALFVCLQWWEMHSGSVDTHSLSEAATNQANVSKAIADQAKTQTDKMAEANRQTDDLIRKATAQAKATALLADAAKQSFTLQSDLFILEQRPYIWFKKLEIGDITNDVPISINITFLNGGKGIAHNIDTVDRNFVVAPNEKTALSFGMASHDLNRRYGTSLPPGEQLFITVKATLSRQEVMDIMHGTQQLYIFGSVLYSDARNVRHRTNWCSYAIPEGHSVGECQYYNDIN